MNPTEAYLDITTHAHTEEQLIKAMEKFGLTITEHDIPEVLHLGADTFLLRKGITPQEKSTLELYLILNEMRHSSPSRFQMTPIKYALSEIT